ncbi:MAG TPA: Wzz/FepE/Etk N-terminal domain-containing protein [Vicinamibacterales bacterium]
MLPGKTYRPEDYVEILWRRKWFAIVPFVIITLGTVIGTQFLPNRYRSDAQVRVVPQQVPENYVQSTVTASLGARLQAISQEIQSRTRLERIIQELNLYEEQRRTMIMEDVVELMRRDISLQIGRAQSRREQPGYFTISFTSDNPRTALQVTERLASQFITENLQDRTVQADQTNQFVETQLEEARRRLADYERRVAEFKRRYAGELPSQVQSNLAVMQSTQNQIQNLAESINRDRDRQIVLDKTMADLMAISAAAAPAAPAKGVQTEQPAAEQLQQARDGLRALQLRLKPEHPDVIRAQRVVRELEQKAQAEELISPVGVGTSARPVLSAAEQKRLAGLQTERETLDRRIAASHVEEERLLGVLTAYRAKVEAAPMRETEETELTRDYTTIQEQYETLLKRSQQSRIAADLERRQIGEQFRLLDAARLPQRPFSPDRPRLNMLGALAGLALGLGLIALLEYRDTTLRTDDDVTLSLSLPVVAVIPVMSTHRERQRARQKRLVAFSASLVAMTGAIAVIVWMMDDIVSWVR